LPASNANVVVGVSTAKPAKPQKVIFKNKAGPPPPKLVMTVKPSVVSTGAVPVAAVAPVPAETASISDSKSQTSISNNNNSIRLHSISNHKVVDEQQQQLSSSKELSSRKPKLSERASSMFSLKGNQENSINSTGSLLTNSEEQLTTTITIKSENTKARKSTVKNRSSVLKESNSKNSE